MTNRLTLALAVMLGTLVFYFAATSGSARQRDTWEYSLQYTDSEGTLNKMGQDGWEVVAAYPLPTDKGGVRVIMKRRRG